MYRKNGWFLCKFNHCTFIFFMLSHKSRNSGDFKNSTISGGNCLFLKHICYDRQWHETCCFQKQCKKYMVKSPDLPEKWTTSNGSWAVSSCRVWFHLCDFNEYMAITIGAMAVSSELVGMTQDFACVAIMAIPSFVSSNYHVSSFTHTIP